MVKTEFVPLCREYCPTYYRWNVITVVFRQTRNSLSPSPEKQSLRSDWRLPIASSKDHSLPSINFILTHSIWSRINNFLFPTRWTISYEIIWSRGGGRKVTRVGKSPWRVSLLIFSRGRDSREERKLVEEKLARDTFLLLGSRGADARNNNPTGTVRGEGAERIKVKANNRRDLINV